MTSRHAIGEAILAICRTYEVEHVESETDLDADRAKRVYHEILLASSALLGVPGTQTFEELLDVGARIPQNGLRG